jgi:uncharacterized protein (DUF433 family)
MAERSYMPTTVPSHITIDDHGIARLGGTGMKVVLLVETWKTGGSTPQSLHEAHPHLTMAQIHAVLAYYYDHQSEIDAEIERRTREIEAARASAEETPGRKKLRDMGLRP